MDGYRLSVRGSLLGPLFNCELLPADAPKFSERVAHHTVCTYPHHIPRLHLYPAPEEGQPDIQTSEYDPHRWLIILSSNPTQMKLAAYQFVDGLLLACFINSLIKPWRRAASSAAL